MASSPLEIWDLPNEVLCYIFSKINVEHIIKCVMNVCQRWRSVVAENKKFWNDIQLVIDCDSFIDCCYLGEARTMKSTYFPLIYIGEKDLEKVPNVQSIKFIEGSTVIGRSVVLLIQILDIISKKCQNVEKVEFFYCFGAASMEVMRFLRERFNRIKEIRYGINTCTMYRLPCDEISRFGNLKTLVCHDIMFKSSDLYHLSEGCEHLNSLWILLCESLKTDDILYFLEKKKNILKELGIGISLQDFILDKLKECHNLEVFFARDAKNVTDVCLKSFAYQSTLKYCSLHQAKFEQTTVFEVAGLSRKPEMFKHLKILDLTKYYNYKSLVFDSWEGWSKSLDKDSRPNDHSKDSSNDKSKGFVEITFNNPYEKSVSQPSYSPTSREHWMYRHRHQN